MKYKVITTTVITTKQNTYHFYAGQIVDDEQFPELKEHFEQLPSFIPADKGDFDVLDETAVPDQVKPLLYLNVQQAIAKASGLTNLELLQEWLKYETRETVKEAINYRIQMLNMLEKHTNVQSVEELYRQQDTSDVTDLGQITETIEQPVEQSVEKPKRRTRKRKKAEESTLSENENV